MTDFRQLPNLAALRAFEAAARHQNFSRAAEEIHVTHGAISHQVRALEQDLGVALFTRNGKRIAITPEGQRFALTVRTSLQEIAGAADALRAGTRQRRLTVSSIPSFAARWLAPRLGKFIDLHPDIEVMLQSSGQLQDLARDSIDVGIRFGSGRYPGLTVEKLMGDFYYPVASPAYNGGRLPASPQHLAHCQPAALGRAVAAMVSGGRPGVAGAERRRAVSGFVDADSLGGRRRRHRAGAACGRDAGNRVGRTGAPVRCRSEMPGQLLRRLYPGSLAQTAGRGIPQLAAGGNSQVRAASGRVHRVMEHLHRRPRKCLAALRASQRADPPCKPMKYGEYHYK